MIRGDDYPDRPGDRDMNVVVLFERVGRTYLSIDARFPTTNRGFLGLNYGERCVANDVLNVELEPRPDLVRDRAVVPRHEKGAGPNDSMPP